MGETRIYTGIQGQRRCLYCGAKETVRNFKVDGYFLNIDVVLAFSDALEQWYLLLWRQWIDERKSFLGIDGSHYDDIARRYKDNTDNKPDTLDVQLNALQTIGFKDVDCFYKYGIFTMYGGKK